jgi:glycosyltransferase involved in cell wall biosynthesis
MKIAVYTIAKNEEQFVQRWAESCKEADYRVILDTGSTDKTLHEIILNDTIMWEQKEFTPWRFDNARNHALHLLPDDIDMCISLDMDEVLQPGWREALEAIPVGTTRPRYKYVWSWNPDGSEGLVYGGDKIHTRHGYRWKHPVHEVLKSDGPEVQNWTNGLVIHHHPDPNKSRAQYLPLLKMAVDEDPRDDRNQFYLAREYYFNGELGLAQYHFSEHLKLSQWHPERAASHRYMAKMRPEAREHHLYLAIAEDPLRRESWAELAKHYYAKEDWDRCLYASKQGLLIYEKPLDYLCEAEAWGPLLHDLAAISLHHLGDSDEAFFQGSIALSLAPTDLRLQANLDHYRL